MTIDVSEVSKTLQRFSWPDYMVFLLMLMSCMIIGVYFGWKDHRKHKHHRARRGSEALDYLVGGRKMQVFPVAMSLVASFISGISLLGTSTEIYVYGTQYCYIFIAIVLTGVVLHYVYLPVYHELQLTSTYEYLHQRFDKKLRLFGSVLFVVNTMLWLPIVCYVPALSFNQVSGINIHIVTPVVCAVCIFYTCICYNVEYFNEDLGLGDSNYEPAKDLSEGWIEYENKENKPPELPEITKKFVKHFDL